MKTIAAYVWKFAGPALVIYALVQGLTMGIPDLPILEQTWRNIYYHVPMWYTMIIMLMVSLVYSLMYLNSGKEMYDSRASSAASVGILFGMLGLATGIVWSRVTWGEAISNDWNFKAWWSWEPKQTSALVLVLIYLGYFLLRSSYDEPAHRNRISAVYNIFGAALIIPAFYLIPRFLGGLHPGSGEEGPLSALKSLNGGHRLVLYPAALGFTLIGVWIMQLRSRLLQLESQSESRSSS